MSRVWRHEVRVYYEDVDFGGVVYYANYLKYLERGRSEALRACGVDQIDLKARGVVFVVRRIALDYLAPARFDDLLTVETELTRLGGASLEMAQAVLRGEERLVAGEVRIACLAEAGGPARLPPDARAALAG